MPLVPLTHQNLFYIVTCKSDLSLSDFPDVPREFPTGFKIINSKDSKDHVVTLAQFDADYRMVKKDLEITNRGKDGAVLNLPGLIQRIAQHYRHA